MGKVFGWAGKLLRVDLTRRKTWVEDWDRSWIGGKAFGQWLLFNEEPVSNDEYDPRRLLIFTSGPLNGTLAPSCSRINLSNRSLLTGGCSSSSAGGFFAPEMKFAGYDHIVITGKAEKPVYLYINDDDVSILDAAQLWGKCTGETDSIILRTHSDPRVRTACIGPAGENRVRMACIIVDRARAAGWGGNGAVMGAKNLKAIAVRGTKPIYIARPGGFLNAVKQAKDLIDVSPGVKELRSGGSIGRVGGKFNPLSFKNYQDDIWDTDKVAMVSSKIFQENYEKRRFDCFNCNISCGRFYTVKEGRYAGLKMEGMQINALRGFGSNLDMASPVGILKASAITNEYGLNHDGISIAVAWAIECFEKGLITEKDLGYSIKWDDIDSFLRLTEDTVYRRGFGDILAEGVARASKKVGKGSDRYAVVTKGAEINEGRLRSHRGWALGIITSPRGSGHMDGAPTAEGSGFDNDLLTSIFGIPNLKEATSYENKPKAVVWVEKFKTLIDSLGLCYFISVWQGPPACNVEEFTRLYNEATGDNKSAEELLQICEKVVNIQKAFNTLHAGFTRKDDYPPPRLLLDPIQTGPFKGATIDMAQWEKMLDEYYELHDWDKTTGRQKVSGLKALGLEQIASRLAEKGLIK